MTPRVVPYRTDTGETRQGQCCSTQVGDSSLTVMYDSETGERVGVVELIGGREVVRDGDL